MKTEAIVAESRWGGVCVAAAPGPSLTPEVAAACAGLPVIAVNDAYRLFPGAEVLYACDAEWWLLHDGCRDFAGERWSSHGHAGFDDKRATAEAFGLRIAQGRSEAGFSFDPALIHYGDNSGFQAVNVAGHKLGWHGRILLVGFDMRRVDGRSHFFGEHPPALRTTRGGYRIWEKAFAIAAARLPATIEIINCTPGSALTCFPMRPLADVLASASRLRRPGAELKG